MGLACAGRSLALVVAPRDRALRVARPLCTGRCPSCAELLEVRALHSACTAPSALHSASIRRARILPGLLWPVMSLPE